MKKKILFAGLALAGAMALSICGCSAAGTFGNDTTGTTNTTGTTDTTGTYQGISSAESVYAMGAVTTATLLSSYQTTETAALSKTTALAAEISDDQVKEFNTYLAMMESFLDEDALKTTVGTNTDAAYSSYQTKLTVSGADANGNTTTYTIYYTETYTKTYESAKKNEYECKTVYSLTGVMLINGTEYAMSGSRVEEIETEGSETETQETFQIRAYTDSTAKNTYVQLAYETAYEEDWNETGEERSYEYTVVQNGSVVEKTSIELETETGWFTSETEFTISFYGTSSSVKSKYEIELTENALGNKVYEVSYSVYSSGSWEKGSFYVTIDSNGDYVYTFQNGTQKRY